MKDLSLWKGPADREIPLIAAYFDESGHSSESRVVAIGGALGPPRAWTRIRKEWSAILTEHGVKVFHMKDFENRYGEFKGWDEKRRRSLLGELLAVLEDVFLVSIGTAVVVEDFQNLKPQTRKGLMDPWYLCLQTCLQDVARTVMVASNEEVWDPNLQAVFFELQLEYWRGPILFSKILENDSFAKGLGLLAFANKRTCVKVQLADLVAYELRRHVENCLFNRDRPTRWSMQQLLKRLLWANCFDTHGRTIRTDNSQMAFFRNADTKELDEGGKVLLGRNLAKSDPEDTA
jgi:hypothetical protein